MSDIKQQLLEAQTEEDFKKLILKQAQDLSQQQQATIQSRIMESTEKAPELEYEYVRFSTFFLPSFYSQ